MRKALTIALGLGALGIFTQTALAVDNCNATFQFCGVHGSGYSDFDISQCGTDWQQCVQANWARGYNSDGEIDFSIPIKGEKSGDSTGGASKPAPSSNKSTPKRIKGEMQKTADGGIVMVTPEGKEWVWNGKYNYIHTINTPHVQEYYSVMQGDPDVTLTDTVDGHVYKVSDPKYGQALDNHNKKVAAETAEKKKAVRETTKKQHEDYLAGARGPGGILGRSGPGVTKEEIDKSATASSSNQTSSSQTQTSSTGKVIKRDHRTNKTAGASNNAPPAAASGTAAPVHYSGTVIRDHRHKPSNTAPNNKDNVAAAAAANSAAEKAVSTTKLATTAARNFGHPAVHAQ